MLKFCSYFTAIFCNIDMKMSLLGSTTVFITGSVD